MESKCKRCWWREGGECFNESIVNHTYEGHTCHGEKIEDNESLLERCNLNMERKREIKKLENEKLKIEDQLGKLYNQSFKTEQPEVDEAVE